MAPSRCLEVHNRELQGKDHQVCGHPLPPGTPTGWRVTNRGARAATVSVVIVGYWRAEPPNTGSPPETSPTPGDPVRTIDPSPGPISANGRYDVGTFTGTDLWVNPTAGSDSNSGASRGSALRTVGAAWNRIPGTKH